MDLELTDEQELLAETARRFLEDQAPVSTLRTLLDDPIGLDADVWRAYGHLGLFGLLVPESHGGTCSGDDGLVHAALVCEEMGRTPQAGPFPLTLLVAEALAGDGQSQEHAAVLADLLAGSQIATWAVAEGDSWDPLAVLFGARRTDAGYVLSGTKDFVQDAHVADQILVTARLDGAVAEFLVPSDLPGISSSALSSLDISRRFSRVSFDDVEIPAAALVGEVGATVAVDRLNRAVVLQCSESVGAATRMFEMAVDYARERISFGRPIGSYQAIKHRLADMMVLLEAATATAAAVAREVGNHPDLTLSASTAKSYVAEACTTVVQEVLQIHGGIGFTWEHDLHLYLRRVKTNEVLLGTPSWHRQRLFDLIGA